MQRTRTDRNKKITFIIISVVLCAFLILIDQLSKIYFKNKFHNDGSTTVIDGFFYFTYTVNTGSAFSFLAGKKWAQIFFKILTPLSLILFSYIFVQSVKHGKKFMSISVVLIISGAIGNFIDRLLFNGVSDFISLQFGDYFFPIFNFADMCLTVGVILLIIDYLFGVTGTLWTKNS